MPKHAQRTVLFLCTGNYYRSRLAEVFFNALAGKMALGWNAVSRGLALERGIHNIGPIADIAKQAIQAKGINRDESIERMPVAVTLDDFEKAQWVVALDEEEHRPLLTERFPGWDDRVEYWNVEDSPAVIPLIDAEVKGLFARLLSGAKRQGAPILEEPAVKQAKEPPRKAASMILKAGRETAGRKGKGVTTVFDTPLDDAALHDLAAKLKQKCGTGGTVKEGRIEIQGDQRERIIIELQKLGYQVKRAGG